MKQYKLVHGDCLKLMSKIPNNSVDLILCDLPYGTTACAWDTIIPFDVLWKHYERILTNNGTAVLFGSQPFSSYLIVSNTNLFKYSLVWKKDRATGHVHSKNKPMKIHEDILIFSKGTTVHENQSANRMTYNPQGLVKLDKPQIRRKSMDNCDAVISTRKSHRVTEREYTNYPISVLEFGRPPDKKRFHPTQKPVELLEYLIKTYSNENDIVLDNTMGSGSTGVAALKTGRKFIGIEKESKYYDIACNRIEEANKPKKKLFL